jgi:hypothetical protein
MLDISLNCVAKNESLHIERSLESVVKYVKEIIFIDHYSIDRTKELATKLACKYNNIKIIELTNINDSDKNKNSKRVTFAEARELARKHSSCDYCFKFDADFVILDDFVEKVGNALKHLKKNKNYSGASFTYYDLYYDSSHTLPHDRSEMYLFKKSSVTFTTSTAFGDHILVNDKTEKLLVTKQAVFFHANNVKPLLNLLYRSRMSEYLVSEHCKKENYFEWLYFRKHAVFPKTKVELIDDIINNLKWFMKNIKPNNDVKNITKEQKKYFGNIDNYSINVDNRNNNDNNNNSINSNNHNHDKPIITYVKTEILRYKNTTIVSTDPDWAKKTKIILETMYDNEDLCNF